MVSPDVMAALGPMTETEFRAAIVELCDGGFVTCTSGRPGDDDATYALGWLPLDNAKAYPREIRERHYLNMLRWSGKGTAQ